MKNTLLILTAVIISISSSSLFAGVITDSNLETDSAPCLPGISETNEDSISTLPAVAPIELDAQNMDRVDEDSLLNTLEIW